MLGYCVPNCFSEANSRTKIPCSSHCHLKPFPPLPQQQLALLYRRPRRPSRLLRFLLILVQLHRKNASDLPFQVMYAFSHHLFINFVVETPVYGNSALASCNDVNFYNFNMYKSQQYKIPFTPGQNPGKVNFDLFAPFLNFQSHPLPVVRAAFSEALCRILTYSQIPHQKFYELAKNCVNLCKDPNKEVRIANISAIVAFFQVEKRSKNSSEKDSKSDSMEVDDGIPALISPWMIKVCVDKIHSKNTGNSRPVKFKSWVQHQRNTVTFSRSNFQPHNGGSDPGYSVDCYLFYFGRTRRHVSIMWLRSSPINRTCEFSRSESNFGSVQTLYSTVDAVHTSRIDC
jgi:hypothetical protein